MSHVASYYVYGKITLPLRGGIASLFASVIHAKARGDQRAAKRSDALNASRNQAPLCLSLKWRYDDMSA